MSRSRPGITMAYPSCIDPECAPDCLSCMLEDVNVRPRPLRKNSARIRHSLPRVRQAPSAIFFSSFTPCRRIYARAISRVKILELLLFLSALPVQKPAQTGYSRAQTALAHSICACLQESTEKKITVQELSQRLGASPSLINNCFRGVYGVSPAAYLRARRRCTARRASSARRTERCWISPGSSDMTMPASLQRPSAAVIGVSPAEYRSGRIRIAAPRRECGISYKTHGWSLIRTTWSG